MIIIEYYYSAALAILPTHPIATHGVISRSCIMHYLVAYVLFWEIHSLLLTGLADANADKTRTRRTRHMFLGRGRGRVRACYNPEKDADAVIFDRVPAS